MSAVVRIKYTHTSDYSGSHFLEAKIGMRVELGQQEMGTEMRRESGREKEEEAEYLGGFCFS